MELKSTLNKTPVLLVLLSMELLAWRLSVLYAEPGAMHPVWASRNRNPSPLAELPPREDAELFQQALAAGLLQWTADGRIAVAPADLPLRRRWAQEHPDLLVPPKEGEPNWLAVPWNEKVDRLHRVLHFSAAGRYVRRHIDLFNARRPEFPHIQRQPDGRLYWRDRSSSH